MNFLKTPEIKQLFKVFRECGAEARLVGGCVRDVLIGIKTADIDVAVNVPPEQSKHILEQVGIKVIPTGIDHGTITAVINKIPFQITSLRQDWQSFGRHAKVIFGTDWLEDAKRRDFTMNAIYLDESDNFYDPFNGKQDLEKGIVRFIGEPRERIKEDYLRILRYYRFLAYYGKDVPEPIKELSELKEGLLALSKERIQNEFFKLLESKNPKTSLSLMERDGVLETLFGSSFDLEKLFSVIELELLLTNTTPPSSTTLSSSDLFRGSVDSRNKCENDEVMTRIKSSLFRRLNVLFGTDSNVYEKSFCLSRKQKQYLAQLDKALSNSDRRHVYYYFGSDIFLDWVLLCGVEKGLSIVDFQNEIKWVSELQRPYFPLSGADFLAAGFMPGPSLGDILKRGEVWWIEHDFQPTKEACLEYCLTLPLMLLG